MAVAHSAISVNFNVDVPADSNINVFGEQAPTVSNVVVAEVLLPVNALYDASHGLIEFWEPSGAAAGDIKVKLASTNSVANGGLDFTGDYQAFAKRLAKGLQKLLCGNLDASAAEPYNVYNSNVEYYKQRDFGRLALGVFSHYMFGHVDATAAITNDVAFVQNMLSLGSQGDNEATDASGVAARYGAWNKKSTMVDPSDVLAWDITGTASDANLAVRLTRAVVDKGITAGALNESSVMDASGAPATLANIVRQVIGQDASRVKNADGSERTRDQHIALRFFENDVIYVNITLNKPNVTLSNAGQKVTATTLEGLYANNKSYTLKITLGPADASLNA
jgi:hypothetical protein